jgi:PTS system mannose-specific IIC component
MLLDAITVAFVGGIICLDRILLQAMLSRPVVIGPIIGLILGDPYTGLISGALIELLWIDRLPVGVYVPPNDSIVAVLVVAGSILTGKQLGHLPKELIALSILLFIPFGILGQKMDVSIMRSNDILSRKAVEDAKRGNIKGISRKHIFGLFKTFSFTTVFIFVFLIFGVTILKYVFPLIPQRGLTALSYTYLFLPLLGVAVALNTINLRGTIPVFCGAFLVVTVVVEFLIGIF